MKPILVKIFKTKNELDAAAAMVILEAIHRSLLKNAQCCIALSGGETPRNVYHLLSQDDASRSIDWSRVHVFFCDERAVSPDHPDSNYGMVEHEWISQISFPRKNVHRIKGEIDPAMAAKEYEQEIKYVFGENPVVFDFILLGVGEDGHIASLFPGTDAVLEKKMFVRPVFVQQFDRWRVTLTLPILTDAHEILILAAGKNKSSIIQRVLGAKIPDTKLPVTLIQPVRGTLRWMIDEEAGSQLTEHSSIIIQRIEGVL